MAARISAEGRVTVSERKSIIAANFPFPSCGAFEKDSPEDSGRNPSGAKAPGFPVVCGTT
jgi:hypothetical protein